MSRRPHVVPLIASLVLFVAMSGLVVLAFSDWAHDDSGGEFPSTVMGLLIASGMLSVASVILAVVACRSARWRSRLAWIVLLATSSPLVACGILSRL